MSMALITVGVALAATAILFWYITSMLSHRRRDRMTQNAQPPPLPPQLERIGAMGGLPATSRCGSPPPLPIRMPNFARSAPGSSQHLPQPILLREATDSHIYNYPKCPYHRIRNIPGQRQMIFWDGTNKVFRCCKGHDFTGREH